MRIDLYTKNLHRVFDDYSDVAVTDVKGKSFLSLLKKRKGNRKKSIRKERKNKCLRWMMKLRLRRKSRINRSEKEDEGDFSGDEGCDDESEDKSKCK